jgi:DNA polymerase III subunit epsilon
VKCWNALVLAVAKTSKRVRLPHDEQRQVLRGDEDRAAHTIAWMLFRRRRPACDIEHMFVSSEAMPAQRSFEELGTPLASVTFCVVDLETTGGSPAECAITEIGAVKVRRGEVLGTLHSLVDPGCPVPAFVRLLTGISTEMLLGAPPIAAVLPSFLEFSRDAVLVAHNARFDVSFLDYALGSLGYDTLPNRVVDTAALARKVLAGEVPNRRLDTLARHLRCAHRPDHRAFSDALATVDVLHGLIERLSGYGVTTLEELLATSRARLDRTFSKLRLTEDLPRSAGVYRFVGPSGKTLYVGKAADVRARVRSYFYGDERRGVRDLLRETHGVSAEPHPTMLEAEVAEVRAIEREVPPYNRAGKRPGRWYVKLALRAKSPKASATRRPRDDGSLYLGPFSHRLARTVLDALRDTAPLHRCARPERCRGCAFADLGTCAGVRGQRDALRRTAVALARGGSEILAALATRMRALAERERLEEAAEGRDRGALLERTLRRDAEVRALVDAEKVELEVGGRTLTVRHGRLVCPGDEPAESGPHRFVAADAQRDARVIASWLTRHPHDARILSVEGSWAVPVGSGGARRVTASGPRARD